MLEGYWMGLAALTLAQFEQAATSAMRRAKFMPTVAELREFAGIDLEYEQRDERYRKQHLAITARMQERRDRDRQIEQAKTPLLPRLKDVWKNIGCFPKPKPAEVEIEQKPRVFDEDHAARVKASLVKLAESEVKSPVPPAPKV